MRGIFHQLEILKIFFLRIRYKVPNDERSSFSLTSWDRMMHGVWKAEVYNNPTLPLTKNKCVLSDV